jgi:hypothetical protein
MVMPFITVLLQSLDDLTILGFGSLHLKDRVVHPLTMRREDLLYDPSAFVISDIVGDKEVHV